MHERGDGIQGVEQEVWIDLRTQRTQLRVDQLVLEARLAPRALDPLALPFESFEPASDELHNLVDDADLRAEQHAARPVLDREAERLCIADANRQQTRTAGPAVSTIEVHQPWVRRPTGCGRRTFAQRGHDVE